jgi:hypothetical protein
MVGTSSERSRRPAAASSLRELEDDQRERGGPKAIVGPNRINAMIKRMTSWVAFIEVM